MPAFAITTEHIDGGAVIVLTGDLDALGAAALRDEVRRHIHRYDRCQITFDCSGIEAVTVDGARGLLEAVRPLTGPGRPSLLEPPPDLAMLVAAEAGDGRFEVASQLSA